MGLDIRLPIGLLFLLLGAVLALYGVTAGAAASTRAVGYNLDLIWGAVLLFGGGLMLLVGLRGRRLGVLEARRETPPHVERQT